MRYVLFLLFLLPSVAFANPYPDPDKVPVVEDSFWDPVRTPSLLPPREVIREAVPILRVRIDWDSRRDEFSFARAVEEQSGSQAFMARANRENNLGSYRGYLYDATTGERIGVDTIGIGQNYRHLTRSLSFRFPLPAGPTRFELIAENPTSGEMESVLTHELLPEDISHEPAGKGQTAFEDLEVRVLKEATMSPALIINVYAEGYTSSRKNTFWQDAQRVARVFERKRFPYMEHIEFRAVFAPSRQSLGSAQNLGMPVPERDSFLGLYYPYWNNFGRWYHVIYPTREERFRAAIGLVPYDYPIALVDSSSYWGVGNFKELTAVPARNQAFEYLLMHEFGHFMGLNEEYEGGGPTELEFAPHIDEPWSQNITFLRNPSDLKWKHLVSSQTPVPTPSRYWRGNGPMGAYQGGYADSAPRYTSHKPGFACIMESGSQFCAVCDHAIHELVAFDLGL